MSTEKQYTSLEEMIKDHPEMEAWKDNEVGYVVPDHSTGKMPDHSTCKGYPWTGVKTEDSYPFENRFTKFQKVMLDPAQPTYVNIGGEKFMHKKIKELACHLIDAEDALMKAEDQIKFMQEDSPFVPEEFGFECVARPESITEAPIKIYCSKYNQNYSIYKVFGKRYDWKLLIKKDDVTFDELTLYFPCHRIAYAFFVAMGVKVEGAIDIEFEVSHDSEGYALLNGEIMLAAGARDYHGAPINISGEIGTMSKVIEDTKEKIISMPEYKELKNHFEKSDALEAISPSKELTPETEPEMTLDKRISKVRKDLGITGFKQFKKKK